MRLFKMIKILFPFGFFALYEDEPNGIPTKGTIVTDPPKEPVNVEQTIQKNLESQITQDDVIAMKSEIASLKAKVSNATKEPGVVTDPEIAQQFSSLTSFVQNISDRLDGKEKLTAIVEILQDNPDLSDENGLPLFDYDCSIAQARINALNLQKAADKISSSRIKEMEQNLGVVTKLTQPINVEELKQLEEQDKKDLVGSDRKAAGEAAARMFARQRARVRRA